MNDILSAISITDKLPNSILENAESLISLFGDPCSGTYEYEDDCSILELTWEKEDEDKMLDVYITNDDEVFFVKSSFAYDENGNGYSSRVEYSEIKDIIEWWNSSEF